MASIKISDLNPVTEINNTDVLPIVNNEETKKVSIEQLSNVLSGGSDAEKITFNQNDTDTITIEKGQKALDKLLNGESFNASFLQPGFRDIKLTRYNIDYHSKKFILWFIYRNTYINDPYQNQETTWSIIFNIDTNNKITNVSSKNQQSALTLVSYNTYSGRQKQYMALATDNTDTYTPTEDYNPATKKYVDDAIKTAIGDALGGSY